MKRFILIAVLVGALTALLAGTALAAGPVTPPGQGFGPGSGICAPGAGATTLGMGGMMRRGAPEWAGESEEVMALLDMTAEQIQAERLAGKSLAQIAAVKGIGEETLIDTILDARKGDLAALVSAGKLTQAQAGLMLDRMEETVKTMAERTGVGPSFHQEQGRRGMGMRFDGSSF